MLRLAFVNHKVAIRRQADLAFAAPSQSEHTKSWLYQNADSFGSYVMPVSMMALGNRYQLGWL